MGRTFFETRVGSSDVEDMNIEWSQRIITQLFENGVRDCVVCAGARNSPLVAVLAKTVGLRLHSFFEERSAAFYALGVTRRTGRPTLIVTTSGTAVAELLPAVVEAFHTGFPLVILTADRPRRLRGTGAPQAIDQVGIFGRFASAEFDLENGEPFDLNGWNRRAAVHINICLDEPLMDAKIETLHLEDPNTELPSPHAFAAGASAEWASLKLTKFLRSGGPLVVVVGTLESEADRLATEDFLCRLNAPVYLEATSGLRESGKLEPLALRSGDKILAWALKKKLIGRVLRIGGVPTVRIWRDLDDPESQIDVLSLSTLPFAGLSRGELLCTDVATALRGCQVEAMDAIGALLSKDRTGTGHLLDLLNEEPQSEPALVHGLSRLLPPNACLYIGNSLPIREWDLAASFERSFRVEANRGVNGIDGQLSTFFGVADRERENWALVGDLTTLYDLSAPWALRTREEDLAVRIVVLNNGGGKIFSRIFNDTLFENRHNLDFAAWAKMWRLDYQRWTHIPAFFQGSARTVIELVPDPEATERFWSQYDAFWS